MSEGGAQARKVVSLRLPGQVNCGASVANGLFAACLALAADFLSEEV